MKNKKALIIVVVVAVAVVIYVVAALTGNLKPAEKPSEENSSTITESSKIEQDKITSLEFGESENFGIKEIGDQILSWVKVNTTNYETEDLEIVVVNPDVAEIQFTDQSGKNQWFRIVAKKSGRTGFYIQTKDGVVKTETKVISVDRTEEEMEALEN